MATYLCQSRPDIVSLESRVLDVREDALLLESSPYYPGGGGQLPDRCRLVTGSGEWTVVGAEPGPDGHLWHRVAESITPADQVVVHVDPEFRAMMRELHTGLHVLNALVFTAFEGALVTGVQMSDDGTARIDFDLPDVDNDRLRALNPRIADIIAQDLPVTDQLVTAGQVAAEPGLIRSKSVAPTPSADGTVRVVEIAGLDRQACGGTHLQSTGQSRPLQISKIKNKGRHNRRVYVALEL